MRPHYAPPSLTERRFASMLLAPPCFLAVARKMRADARADLFVTMPALDGPIMRRLMILVSDQLAAGVTDVVLDCAAVHADDVTKQGLEQLVKLGNELKLDPRTRGTLTVAVVSDDVFALLDRAGLADRSAPLMIERAFPITPTSLEAFGL